MTSGDDPNPPPRRSPTSLRSGWRAMPRWKKTCILVGVLLLVVAAVLWVLEPRDAGAGTGGGSGTSGTSGGTGATAQSLLPGHGGKPAGGSAGAAEDSWSGGFFKMGFSFFVGLAIGTALRTFLKLALIACGLAFLLLFWLGSIELITVNWHAMDAWFESAGRRIGDQFESLKTLMTGALPAAGLGTLGLYSGLRRR